jgi:hypothetical protein
MSLAGSKSRLSAVTKELAVHWHDTKTSWNDSKSYEFEKRYMEELISRVDKTVGIVEKLDEVLAKIRGDCE